MSANSSVLSVLDFQLNDTEIKTEALSPPTQMHSPTMQSDSEPHVAGSIIAHGAQVMGLGTELRCPVQPSSSASMDSTPSQFQTPCGLVAGAGAGAPTIAATGAQASPAQVNGFQFPNMTAAPVPSFYPQPPQPYSFANNQLPTLQINSMVQQPQPPTGAQLQNAGC